VARERRIEIPGGYYHVAARGNNKQEIFDRELRAIFVHRTADIARRYGWLVFAWALMSNHFHLVIQIGDAGLSEAMWELNSWFARASNARFGRINHCFGRRFWSSHLATDRHLLASVRYAMWNPARAGIGDDPAASGWTSYRETVGLDHPSKLLAHRELLEHFDPHPVRARAAFSRFVSEGRVRCQAPWQQGLDALT
jgi:REP element-mobilizing transposase RayT